MRWMSMIIREVVGLFVEDGSFAIAVLAWLIVIALILPRLGMATGWEGLTLFTGLALILVESAARRAKH